MIETPRLITGVVAMDETYIGAKKPRKESKDKDENDNYPKNPRGCGTKKQNSGRWCGSKRQESVCKNAVCFEICKLEKDSKRIN